MGPEGSQAPSAQPRSCLSLLGVKSWALLFSVSLWGLVSLLPAPKHKDMIP